MEEIWKPIKGFEEKYYISNKGNVLAKNYGRSGKSKLLKPTLSTTGYLKVELWTGTKRKIYKLHRLIAEAFIPNPENKPCIDHINTIRTDNRIENLRWVTHKENMRNILTIKKCSENAKKREFSEETRKKLSYTTKHRKNAEAILIKMKKASVEAHKKKVICIETGIIYESARDASKCTGASYKSISRVCLGQRKSTKGFRWKFAQEPSSIHI